MATYSSDSDNDLTPTSKLLGRQRPIHSVLGGGKGINFNFVRIFDLSSLQEMINFKS